MWNHHYFDNKGALLILILLADEFMTSCTFIHLRVSCHLDYGIMGTSVYSPVSQNLVMAPNDNHNCIPFDNELSYNHCIFFADRMAWYS